MAWTLTTTLLGTRPFQISARQRTSSSKAERKEPADQVTQVRLLRCKDYSGKLQLARLALPQLFVYLGGQSAAVVLTACIYRVVD
jgi:hypothetical protein